MEAYYAKRAGEYEDVYLKPERQSDLRLIEQWLPSLFAGESVLEVACGTGYWTQFVAPVAGRVVALDASPETLEIARSRVRSGTASFVTGDAYALSPSLGSFSAAFAGFWFSHVPIGRRREFLGGLSALLRPGARVVFLDNVFVAGSSSPVSDIDAEGNTYQLRKLSDGSTHRVLKNFPTPDELHASLGPWGSQGKVTTWEYYWAFEYVAVSP
jgi:demethylmenaquinone methyltransferase/2-methoxy-6-polyprenyl-1,4-benzoquinol methylase